MKVNCKQCQIEFEKSSTEVRKHPNHFCSRSCSAKFNNKGKQHNPPKKRICSKCNNPFFSAKENRKSKLLCSNCREKYEQYTDFLKSKTLAEYYELSSIKGKHPSWRNSHIRALNRSWNKNMVTNCKCGYSKHVELCHIKPISSFPETATLGEINSPENIKAMCPNCHWEFDYGH